MLAHRSQPVRTLLFLTPSESNRSNRADESRQRMYFPAMCGILRISFWCVARCYLVEVEFEFNSLLWFSLSNYLFFRFTFSGKASKPNRRMDRLPIFFFFWASGQERMLKGGGGLGLSAQRHN